ncbi:flagellar biosynthesis protein FlhA [Planctomycetes bacterium K23_9]|uniref:Flagellar biosynthesis protein FlhA n=1 Tax=Stieleria marina TaxID=1930275 RepID=A0A517NP36_9BACT|nr:Flagellar biosynthesis protein FlhA [Planctomycetes bacterium K23_9]
MEIFSRYRDLLLPVGIIACLVVILVPLPPAMMDFLLAANITVGVVVLLTTIQVATPLEFSVFPSLLLATTLSRLVLNVATTRLILTSAQTDGIDAAGGVIRGFGEFVAGDRIEVGLIIFVILVLIQFVVITKGSSRISEVAARFALDGMPGRQMAIDADVNAGLIDEAEAHRRRDEIRSQADFYGAMDGASKFVRGDAIAGIVITVINIIGGLYIGVVTAGMPIAEAGAVFTKLTIGDGLVSQIPSLLISLAAGLLVTRSAQRTNLSEQFLHQLLGNKKALAIAGAFLLLLIVTNLPTIPMATLGMGCIGLAIVLNRNEQQQADKDRQSTEAQLAAETAAANQPRQKQAEDYLSVDPMEVSIGMGLLGLADPSRGGDLMQRISALRNTIATDIGIILPKVRVRDDSSLNEQDYAIRILGNVVATGTLEPDKALAIDTGMTTGEITGTPASNLRSRNRAKWIDTNDAQQAAVYGYVVEEPCEVLVDHLRDLCTVHADELLSRDAAKHLIEQLRETSPTVVEELIPDVMRLSDVQQVLQLLLQESVPIRQLGLILEILGDHASRLSESPADPIALCAAVRTGLSRTICARLRDRQGVIHAVRINTQWESELAQSIDDANPKVLPLFALETTELTCERIQEAVKNLIADGHPPVILVNPRIRTAIRQITRSSMSWLHVLSYDEIANSTRVESHEVIDLYRQASAA